MFETEKETLNQAIDPPDNQGSGASALNMDSTGVEQQAIDPPDNQGSGGTTAQ